MSYRIHAIATIYKYADLLPHFVAYYQFLGVDEIHLLVNENGLERRAESTIREFRSFVRGRYSKVYTSQSRTEEEMRLKDSLVGSRDIYIAVDLDEFHEYQKPVREIADAIHEGECDYVMGQIRDHVTPDGTLPRIGEQSLWTQFSYETNLTKRLLKADPRCVMACHKSISLVGGRHQSRKGCPATFAGIVHHFKWHETVVPLLEDRCEIMAKTKNRFVNESRRALDHFAKHGSIDIRSFDAQPTTYDPQYLTHE